MSESDNLSRSHSDLAEKSQQNALCDTEGIRMSPRTEFIQSTFPRYGTSVPQQGKAPTQKRRSLLQRNKPA